MSISYPPSNKKISGPEVITVIAGSATNAVALAANPARANGCFAINNASRVMYISFDGSPTSSRLHAAVPADGGVIDIPAGYTGAVNVTWAEGVTGDAAFHEFSYV